MAQLPQPTAALRLAVRRSLTSLPQRDVAVAGPLVLVACSGGADSLALAATTAFVAPRLGLRYGLITVDHGLQAGSAQRASAVAAWASSAGFAPAEVATVSVAGRPGGPEAAARSARYAALTEAAERLGAVAVLLGHTRDDQAETVLLALARGAGPRGLSGMPYQRGVFLRPLLDVPRADTRKACAALGLSPWEDPHNSDPAYARSRVRAHALPALIEALGPAVVDNLARTAAHLALDNETLDDLARAALAQARIPPPGPAAPGQTVTASEPAASTPPTPAPGSGGVVPMSDPAAPRLAASDPAASDPASSDPAAFEPAASTPAATALAAFALASPQTRAVSGQGGTVGGAGGAWGVRGDGVDVGVLGGLTGAVRGRVLHLWARELGAPGAALSHRHVAALDALVTAWRGQGPTHLPGGIVVARRAGRLVRVEPADM